MISFVRGNVRAISADSAVIEAQGIGYRIYATATTLANLRIGEEALLHTSFVVREDSMTLYGFADDDECETFNTLLAVSGIGPRIALAVLSVHTPDSLRNAVAGESLAALTQVPGIGKKGAQRMILELAHKLSPVRGEAPADSPSPAHLQDVVDALMGLGWNDGDATRAVAEVEKTHGQLPVAQMLRLALQELGKS